MAKPDTRHKNKVWGLTETPDVGLAQLGLLMDIRDELQRLNSLLHCPNFTSIPAKLDRIVKNTAKPRKVVAK